MGFLRDTPPTPMKRFLDKAGAIRLAERIREKLHSEYTDSVPMEVIDDMVNDILKMFE